VSDGANRPQADFPQWSCYRCRRDEASATTTDTGENMMKPSKVRTFSTVILLSFIGGIAAAADRVGDIGKGEYNAACASCHGLTGMGDGPAADQMKAKVPDITRLALGNNGVFPFDRVYQIIDGRQEVKAHGSREMPIWGMAFRRQSSAYFDNYPAHDAESGARSRILALTEYIYRLQQKDAKRMQSAPKR